MLDAPLPSMASIGKALCISLLALAFTLAVACGSSQDYNFTLANNRADAIRKYLVSQGVEIGRISVVSHCPRGPEVDPKIERRAVFASERE